MAVREQIYPFFLSKHVANTEFNCIKCWKRIIPSDIFYLAANQDDIFCLQCGYDILCDQHKTISSELAMAKAILDRSLRNE